MTPDEEYRLTRIRRMKCICCEYENVTQPLPTEAHHIVDGGYRKHSGGHMASIPLCRWHHRGVCLESVTTSDMLFRYGPALALHKKRFVETYGTERRLLQLVDSGKPINGVTLF